MTRVATALLLILLGWQAPAAAATPVVTQAWIRVLPGDLPLAGYLVLRNPTGETLTLTGARSPAFAAIEIHRSSSQSGVARMQRYERLDIPPHATVTFEPGGYHLMLFDRRHALQPGESLTLTLEFADGSSLPVPFALREAGAR